MAIKAELVSQLEGFGNRSQKRLAEHFRSSGLSKSTLGMIGSPFVKKWFYDYTQGTVDFPQFTTFDEMDQIAYGFGGDVTNGLAGNEPVVYSLDNDGNIWGSQDGTDIPQMQYPHNNSSHFGTGDLGGLITDQKGRLLFAGRRYLGMFDPTVSAHPVTVTLTNGSKVVTKTAGANFASTMVRQFLVILSGGNAYFYRIGVYTSTTVVELTPNFDLATGSYTGFIGVAWTDRWKDFGSEIGTNTSDGYDRSIPCEVYEDTVLFGRGNNITTLNTVTDTVSTDASPAFNMPTGYDCLAIHQGSNGILMGFNFQGKGVLVLWDNYSDRSIAPWITLNDRLISVCKKNGNWIVITAREIFETNGYSLTPVADKIIDMDIDPLEPQLLPQTSVVIENELHFITDFSLHGKRRAGIHKMNLETKLVEYIPREDMEQKTLKVNAIYYGGPSRLYVAQTDSLGYVDQTTQTKTSSLISNPIGIGDNIKHAEAVKLNLGISPAYYALNDTPFSFEVAVRICPINKQIFTYGLVKTTQTVSNEIVVNETTYGVAEVGDEIEFIMGNNAGYSRNILSKSGTGATVTYTLDRALPALSTANDYFMRTKFQLVKNKVFTDVTKIDPALLHFDVKNKTKGKQFMIKVDIEDATVPLEVRPFYFIYDDLGIL